MGKSRLFMEKTPFVLSRLRMNVYSLIQIYAYVKRI